MSSFKTYLDKIQELTDKNLQILSLLNESFYSRKTSTSAIVGDTTYTIPSFIVLENKINDLEGNWNRLISAPDAGSARFVLDGTSKKILLSGYETAPAALTELKHDATFAVEENDVFRDFISPKIYMKFNLDELPANIKKVNVRKVSIKNSDVTLTPGATNWVDFWPLIEGYTEDVDYTLYDKIYDLPLYVNDYDGTFTVKDIDVRQDGKNIYWDVELDKYTYTYDSGTLNGDLLVGDTLISKDGDCKFLVKSCDYNTNTFTLLVTSGYEQPQVGTQLRYFKSVTKVDKYVKVPLEEDQYIAIFIAPINDDVNTSAMWSGGVVFNTDELKDADNNTFRDVYDNKIKNLGDILNDITQFVSGSLSGLSDVEAKKITTYTPPVLTDSDYSVGMLNDHLLDNTSVEQIRRLNNEKANISADLVTIQNQIDEITSILMSTDLSSESASVREEYDARLKSLNTSSVSKTQDYISKINEISTLAGSAVLPTSGAKYTIKGAIDTKTIKSELGIDSLNIIRVEILYRYKNINKTSSNATTVSNMITVSDWNKYIIDYRQKVGTWNDSTKSMEYKFEDPDETNTDSISPQWKTFSIPITQGETVDIYYRVQYDLGYPYVSTFSGWSEITNVEFPEDLIEYSDVDTIIATNRSDARDAVVTQELISGGVTDHVNDKVIDQDLTYFHRPESISSGFYTEDSRRIISLKDKLYSLSNELEQLKLGVFGGSTSYLSVSVYDDVNSVTVNPNKTAADSAAYTLNTKNYTDVMSTFTDSEKTAAGFSYTVYIDITNTSTVYPISLYSLFYGDTSTHLYQSTSASKFNRTDYTSLVVINAVNATATGYYAVPQRLNQLLYLREKNRWTGKTGDYNYYFQGGSTHLVINSWDELQISSSIPGSYYSLEPGETITLPIHIVCNTKPSTTTGNVFSFRWAFDLWTSPFADPLTYDFSVVMPYASNISRRTSTGNTRKKAVTGRSVSATSSRVGTIPATTVRNS